MSTADRVAFIRSLANQGPDYDPVDVTIVPGSWDPKTGTAHATISDTGTLLQGVDPDSSVVTPSQVPILTLGIGVQAAPIGAERGLAFRFGSSYAVLLVHGEDDSPQAPQGEVYVHLRSADQALVNACYLHVKNAFSDLGHLTEARVTAPLILLNLTASNDDNAIVRKEDLQQAIDDITSYVQDAINQLAEECQPGDGVPPPTLQQATAEASMTSYTE